MARQLLDDLGQQPLPERPQVGRRGQREQPLALPAEGIGLVEQPGQGHPGGPRLTGDGDHQVDGV
jgi:hypothetical protein